MDADDRSFVVDASVVLAWALPDEASDYADAVLAVVERRRIRVPAVWPLEVANGLALALKRGRIGYDEIDAFLRQLERLSITAQTGDALQETKVVATAAIRLDLTAYYAAYVVLAKSEGHVLATLDDRMKRVAHQEGVEVFVLAEGRTT